MEKQELARRVAALKARTASPETGDPVAELVTLFEAALAYIHDAPATAPAPAPAPAPEPELVPALSA
jgi:hypothetical protein